MKLFLGIILIIADTVVADPEKCLSCIGNVCNNVNVGSNLQGLVNLSDTGCASSFYSLGTTHCGSAVIKYRRYRYSSVYVESFRGCFNCTDKKAACFALGGFLKALKGWIVLKCQIECCNETNCNNFTRSFITDAITVFDLDAPGPWKCQECTENDADLCTLNQRTETCKYRSYNSGPRFGKAHCGSAKIKTRHVLTGMENVTIIRGCINCEDKKAACAIIAGYVKHRQYSTLLECEIDCCNDTENCNDGARNLLKCNLCMGSKKSNCHAISNRKDQQICSLDPDALGTSQCGTAVGKSRNENGVVQDYFYRGCIDCADDKRAACFGLGGYLKGDIKKSGQTTVLQCDVQCCNNTNGCNNDKQDVNLLPAAVTVFTPSVSGPTQCNVCLENDASSCSTNLQVQICATNPYSLGTTHCGSAVGRYRDSRKNIVYGFFRGCINCADKKAACAAIGGFRKNVQKWTQLECEIECCTADSCNTHIPALGEGYKTPSSTIKPKTAKPETKKPTEKVTEKPTEKPINTQKPTKPSGETPSGFQKACLEAHNDFRYFHGVPLLKWSARLSRDAQNWANHLAASGKFDHVPTVRDNDQGENLYYTTHPKKLCAYGKQGPDCLCCEDIVQLWYDEEANYDYNIGKAKTTGAKILHFTQIIWKASREVGMATAVANNRLVAVARYSPVGNRSGEFKENVPPPINGS